MLLISYCNENLKQFSIHVERLGEKSDKLKYNSCEKYFRKQLVLIIIFEKHEKVVLW